MLGEVDGPAEVGRAVEAAQEPLHHRAREQLEVADPGQDLRLEEPADARTSRRVSALRTRPVYIPDRGSGTAASSSSTIRVLLIRSDSAWKLVRMRWRKTGWARARMSSKLTL